MVKSISGGYLAQTADHETFDRAACVVKTKREPTPEEWIALEFGWKVVKHVKSNAIVYARAGQTVGGGRGTDEPRGFGQHRRHESASAARRAVWWHRTPSSRFPTAWSRR